MLESDYCPYCDYEIVPRDVFEITDVSVNEVDESVECPNCGKFIRASLEPLLTVGLSTEEAYLSYLSDRKEWLEDKLENDPDKRIINFYKDELSEIEREIRESRENIKINEELENEN